MVQHMVNVLLTGGPSVQVARLHVTADDAYEFPFRKQVPDDATVFKYGLDGTRPHRLEYWLRRYGAGRPFREVHFDVRVTGQSKVRSVIDHERGLVVGREQLIRQTHGGGELEKKYVQVSTEISRVRHYTPPTTTMFINRFSNC